MDIVRLAGVGLAAAMLGGTAWGQAVPYNQPKPSYEEALTAVTWGGCKRADAERYIRFFCPEGEALWYFTVEGRPEHETYFVGPIRYVRHAMPIFGDYRNKPSQSREGSLERIRAHQSWMGEILRIWREDAQRMQERLRDSGKLYPLEPS